MRPDCPCVSWQCESYIKCTIMIFIIFGHVVGSCVLFLYIMGYGRGE